MEGHYGSIKLMLIMNVGHNCALEMINDPRVDLRDQTRNWWWHFMLQRRWQLKRLVKCSHGYNAGFRALHPPACSMPTCTHHQYACMHAHLSLWLSLCFLRYVIFLFDHFPFSFVPFISLLPYSIIVPYSPSSFPFLFISCLPPSCTTHALPHALAPSSTFVPVSVPLSYPFPCVIA